MTDNIKLRREIREYIGKLKSAEDIFGLFKLLNYPDNILFDVSYKRKKEEFDFKKEDVQRIKEIYAILSFDEKLPVFLIEAKTLTHSFIRSVTTTFDKQYLHFLLIFSVDYSEVIFVFPKREKVEAGKHKLKLTKLIINKEEIIDKKEHYTVIEILSNIYFEKESTWRDIWRKWNKAFSVERVTEAFFEDYKNIFFTLRKELDKQKIPKKEAHEFTLQFLNRIMFIYFISKKKWLGNVKFMEWLWTSYKKLNKYGSDEFYDKWLRQVFFKAFNNRSNEITGLPEEVKRVISNAPYLNGGLFRKNGLDDLKIKITDKLFQKVFDFFEKYNFTIKEDMPLDQEVAVDPQMIGYVYESLAYVGDEIYDRNDLGIFYTPRVEVDFMCRRAIVEYLSKHLTKVPKDKIYHLVFELSEEKEKIEKWFDKEGLWYKLEEVLDNLSAVDPACGSGAFLVGLLNVLAELYRIVYKHIKRDLTDFELKNKIIQYSLYGVDVMPWAIHAAELRLWLQLIVETEFKKEELRKHPLLPNLNLNLRIGDSLVQEIGGISFNIRTNDLKPHLKKKLDNLKQEKRKYFENSPTAKFKTPEEVKAEEIRLFEEIIDERIEGLKKDIESLENDMKKRGKQVGLFSSEINVEAEVYLKEKEKINAMKKEIEDIKKEIEKLKRIKELLKDPEKKPFVWDIDFAEIFGDKNGFDIVIGNPPYVRQEMISPPNKLKAEVSLEDRREYKEKLIKSVKNIFPVIDKIDKKSDYYIYFYFHGLGLLNDKGTFCFITSNSWLDVGYGKNLQEFLLKYVPITAIYDNPKRSFAHADVNTIIALFGAPKFAEEKTIHGLKISGNGNNWPMLNHTAKFVMFKKPFKEVINAKNLIEIENVKVKIRGEGITELVKNVVKTKDYRVFPILQEDLLEDGWEYR
ncbi:MAG: Eco57I restriction-modification methylase domain-containing protein [Candidatus Diapherotrites archaeon]|nr:Eco57I restriction-modification methylase domain-containing protein [Candidatus Diapherotrites archaeon]